MQTIFICAISFHLFAQNIQKPIIDASTKLGSAIKSQEFTLQRVGETNTISSDLKWLPTLTNKCIGRQHRIPDQELIEKMKHEKTLLKESATLNKGTGSENSMLSVSPVVGTNF